MTFASFVNYLLMLANPFVALLAAVALAIFLWGVLRYIYSAAASSEKSNGREMIVWGLIALVVLVCVWGIVNLLRNTFLSVTGGSASYYSSGYGPGSPTPPSGTPNSGSTCISLTGNCALF